MDSSPTVFDVAARAQVSKTTVMRVIHNNGPVAKKTRARILKAIEETGYEVNMVARNLRRQDTRTIGHVLTAITHNPFFAEVALGVEEQAIASGYDVLIYNVQQQTGREAAGVAALLSRRVSSVIFTTAALADNVDRVLEAGLPVVQVERAMSANGHLVLVDNYTGACDAMRHLIDLGHQTIAYIGGSPDPNEIAREGQTVEEQRLAGWRDSLLNRGYTADESMIRVGPYKSFEIDGYGYDGMRAMGELLDREVPPTAVLIGSDILAAGALQEVYRRRMRLPDDLSVVGFDDTISEHLSPPLTTVALPMREIGRAAAELAIEGANGKQRRTVRLTASLRLRESTAPPPR